MRGIRFSSLSIGAFRGISGQVEFDLSAPLTLIYAPNGTGKTTMCEAAEWLLTGQVERLKEGKDFDANMLRSKFAADGRIPSAEAELLVTGKPRFLTRTADGAHSTAKFGRDASKAKFSKPHQLLSLLAPAAAANETHHLTAINLRQRWLKGTRFMSAEALAALVDTDPETIERRTQVFADLLGIRHLLDAERQCEKYLTEIASRARSVAQTIVQQSADIEALEQSLSEEPPPSAVSARSEGEAAARLLNEEMPRGEADSSFDSHLEALTAVHRRQRHAFDRRSDVARRVEAQWSTRVSLAQTVADLENKIQDLVVSLAEVEEKGRTASAFVAERSSLRDAATESARKLSASKAQLTRLSSALLSALQGANMVEDRSRSLGWLTERISESRWTAAARDQHRQELTNLRVDLENAASEAERLLLIEQDLATLRATLLSEEEISALRNEVADAESRARTARAFVDATADPVARLQSAARELLDHNHEAGATKCPVCAHDWGEAERLRRAISLAARAAPEIVELARSGAEAAEEIARELRARLEAGIAVRARVGDLERERMRLAAAADQRRRKIERLGLPSDRVRGSILDSCVRLDVGDALGALLEARDAVIPMLPPGSLLLLPPDTTLSGLLSQLEASLGAREQQTQFVLSELVTAIETQTAQRDEFRAVYAALQQRLKEMREELRKQGEALARLSSLWEDLAPGTEWSDSVLDELKADLVSEANRLSSAEAHIVAARAAWATESRRARLAELRAALQPSLDRQERLTARIDAAQRARAVFHETYTTTSRKQVQDLSKVVNPLFARMHANRVFDRIKLGDDSEFLHWLADAGGEQLDPGKDFSQGQRQDLALALFLARARSLGGTFFLDEPVMHLDDLNRVGLLDILRAIVLEGSQTLNLVITSSSRALARHLIEKFAAIDTVETPLGAVHPLRVIELDGNGRSGVELSTAYPLA